MNDQVTDRNIAATAQQMLKGVHLTGNDVPTFVAIHNWLEAIAQGQLVLVTPTAPSTGMTLPREVTDEAPDLNQPAPAQE